MARYGLVGMLVWASCFTLAEEKVTEVEKQEVSVVLLGTVVPLYPMPEADEAQGVSPIIRDLNAFAVHEVVKESANHVNAKADTVLVIVPGRGSEGLWRGDTHRGADVELTGRWNKRTHQVHVERFEVRDPVDWRDVTLDAGTITLQQEL